MGRRIKRVCNLCEAMCGLNFDFDDLGQYTIRGNPADVFSKGAFCPKSQGLKDLHEDPDRLRSPLKKLNGEFVEVSWKEAFDDIAKKLNAIQSSSGNSSVASYIGNPNGHNFGNLIFLPLFLKGLRTRNKYSATSVDQLPHMLVAQQMFGHQLLFPIADIDHAKYLLVIGANPAVSNGSLLSSSGLSAKIKKMKDSEGKVVVLDPRYTETASLASEHHFIRPGTDAFFLAALARMLLEKKQGDIGRLKHWVKNFDDLAPLFEEIDLEQVCRVTGLSPEIIRAIADDLTSYETAICYGRFGVSTQAYGTVCQWLINVINIVSGNFDRKGGVLFTKPAVDVVALMAKTGAKGSFARHRSRVRGLPEFSGEYPSSTLADEILTEGKGQIKGLLTIAGNPVLSLPNGKKMEKALEGIDFYVAIDLYQNETTRFADYILPPTSSLEHSHFDLLFNALATRNTIRYSEAVVPPEEGGYEDWEILLELWSRLDSSLSRSSRLFRKVATNVLRRVGTDRLLDLALRTGPYRSLSLKKLKNSPDGIDLGPLEPSLPDRLYSNDKRINLLPNPIKDAFQLFQKDNLWKIESYPDDEWMLIGRRNLKSNNSWMHNLPSLHRSKDQCFAIMNEGDAGKLGIKDGGKIKLSTAIGSIDLPVSLSTRIMPGVISVPHGWGHHRRGTRLRLAEKLPGVSLNDILNDSQIDQFSGNAVLNGQRVSVASLS